MKPRPGSYAKARLKWSNKESLPFLYENTGIITRFTDGRDPKPRSREVFSFHRPETLKQWRKMAPACANAAITFRRSTRNIVRPANCACAIAEIAITNLEQSFKDDRPRANLIQMATGAGKTYTADHFYLPPAQARQRQTHRFFLMIPELGRTSRAGK